MTGVPNTTPLTLSGRYRLERRLGRGAMGEVYLARDLKHGREVAVKVLAPETAHALSAERFLSEIRTAAALNHPHILTVHDSGEEAGRLYYVMPRVEGDSLRDLLDREGRLAVTRATDIACQIARGLAYAHARGIVHRDIKPGNILLDRTGHVYIADFGLALAFDSVQSTRRTATGVAVGSPLYMSPEQAGGGAHVDARADIYALGCVLYEMLIGAPPFDAQTVREVLLLHMTEPAPSLRGRRADISPALDRTVRTALAKEPADRFSTAQDLADALGSPPADRDPDPRRRAVDTRPSRPRWLRPAVMAGAAVVVLAGVLATLDRVPGGAAGAAPLDTLRYAVLPFQREDGVPATLREDLQLHQAFEGWNEIQLASRLQVGDALERIAGSGLNPGRALEVARDLGAGRYVFGSVAALGDSARIDAGLFDTGGGGRELRRATALVPLDQVISTEASTRIATALLFGRVTGTGISAGGTRSIRATHAYAQGHSAVEEWDLSRADSLFEAATGHDPEFARAHLWLAQVRNWAGAEPAEWRAPAERAARDQAALSEYERTLASGLVLLAGGAFPEACAVYDSLRLRDSRDFAAWHGLGDCRHLDDRVVADPASATGWRFRGSAQDAVEAYRRAFQDLPLSHRGGTFERVLDVFWTEPNQYREGRDASGLSFAAFPMLQGDTLAFLPNPNWRSAEWWLLRTHPATVDALLHQRRVVQDVAERWVNAFPGSSDALEARALALDVLGDPAAVEAYGEARSHSDDRVQRWRLARAEVWARVKFGVPHQTASLAVARELADSLVVSSSRRRGDHEDVAALAVLIGRPEIAASAARSAAAAESWAAEFPRPVDAAARALTAFAATGGPRDSIIALEGDTERAIRSSIAPAQQREVRHLLMDRAALLAFPHHSLRVLDDDGGYTVPVAHAYAAFARGEHARARDALPAQPPEARPIVGSVSFDIQFPTAWLLTALGDWNAAVARLDAAFATLPWVHPRIHGDPALAGGLVRAIALRARVADLTGDESGARAWGAAFETLWANAAPELRQAALASPPSTAATLGTAAHHPLPGGSDALQRPR